MYGPPPNCRRFELGQRDSPRKCIRPLSGQSLSGHLMMIRTCRSLQIARITRDALSPPGFSDAPLDCSFVSFSPPQTVVERGSSWPSWRWKSGKRSVLSKHSVFSTAIRLQSSAAADVDSFYRWTTSPRRCEPTCWQWPRRPCCVEHVGRAGAPTARTLRCRS